MRSIILLAALAIGCATPADLLPKTGPNSEYPCGTTGHVCPATNDCCWNFEVCGGGPFNGCPEGMCCTADIGMGADTTPRKQRPSR